MFSNAKFHRFQIRNRLAALPTPSGTRTAIPENNVQTWKSGLAFPTACQPITISSLDFGVGNKRFYCCCERLERTLRLVSRNGESVA
jgi:hypothetical protein